MRGEETMNDPELPPWRPSEHLNLVTRPLGILTAVLVEPAVVFDGPSGTRKLVGVSGGSLVGPRLRATVLPGGGDWAMTRPDGVLVLDVRLTLRTEDGAVIYMTYAGMRHASLETTARLARGETVSPADMYFRIAPRFETGDERYAWLNRILCVGVGERLRTGPRYHLHEIL
jgi:hypothetical protein